MSAFRDIMSIVDPTAPKTAVAPKKATPTGPPKSTDRPNSGINGAVPAPQLKRKASGAVESVQTKVQRKEGSVPSVTSTDSPRLASTSTMSKFNASSAAAVPYKGTAAPASSRPSGQVVRKPLAPTLATAPPAKAAAPALHPTVASSASVAPAAAAPKKGYLALLQKAKEKDLTKPVAAPSKVEPTKILSRKERLALKAEASTAAKGKKAGIGTPVQAASMKDTGKERRKPVDVGYQGTARPTKKAVEIAYKGTARPSNATPSSARNGAPIAKSKPKPAKDRYDGYADWSDLNAEDDEEEDYESDISSDMEGGMWDVEEEEARALKAAKQEDAAALAEETELKRQKEERKRKLVAMQKAAVAKKRY